MPVEDGDWDELAEIEVADLPDSEDLDSNSLGPGEVDSDSLSTTTEPHQEDQTEPEELPEFDPKVRQDFEGLLYLGKLMDTFEWMGHRFVIKTLLPSEIMEIGLIHREYAGSLADVKAYQAAVVAGCVVSVDDQTIPVVPLTNEDVDTALLSRFQYVINHWFPPVLDAVYEKYLTLEIRVEAVMDAMAKAYGWTVLTPTLTGTSD